LYDDSPLARFVIQRGLSEPKFLGHQLFWQLMSEAHLSHIRQRFTALLINFLYGMGSHREELLQGYQFTQQLVELNRRLYHLDYLSATGPFREALAQIEIPAEFHLPMDPRLIVSSFIIPKCKVMNSKKKPFWLAFQNASPFATEPVMTMLKVGDDLRQDQLTLQLIKVMESLWRTNGADFHMRCYGVLPTGFEQGFIEVVPNAVTESELQKERGTISGVWANDLFTRYLQKHSTEKGLAQTRAVFRKSSAGYAVATSVLGVADRHPGNIMVQQDGHFFHIDFGHFLGNWKVKYGVKREDGSFHCSPACAETIGDDRAAFEEEAKVALRILRKNSKLLITLFLLMLGTGIPELKEQDNILYVKKRLYMEMDDDQAAAAFAQLIRDSIASTTTKLNNLCHNWKTG
jgi:phosphatidylinositol-4,5-bisphosphate 3-kinase